MIIVVSSSAREARALAALTGNRPRPAATCESVAQFRSQLRKSLPSVVLARARLVDGYSDDILALLSGAGCLPETRVIVLAGADCTPQQEARQLSLGADCVLRDPLRPGVLLEYTAKFLRASAKPVPRLLPPEQFMLAGVTVLPDQQKFHRANRLVPASPKEIELARFLAESPGKLLTYGFLYSELFNRSFGGDSSNLRVLLGKLAASFRKLGVDLRSTIRVTAKSGYCYLPPTDDGASEAGTGKTARKK